MNLVVDIGNSSSKLAVFSRSKIIFSARHEKLTREIVKDLIRAQKIERAIVSSVIPVPRFIGNLLKSEGIDIHILSFKSKLPFKIDYKTPETLGTDRIAAAAGAFSAFPDSDLLIIDAGTAITFDLLANNRFAGGNISPGIDTRFRALNRFTGRLPLLSRTWDFSFPGTNTEDAITAGVITGVVYEINEYIRTFEEKHKNLKVIITGGDSGFLKKKIKTGCIYSPDIVTEGLKFILDYNA